MFSVFVLSFCVNSGNVGSFFVGVFLIVAALLLVFRGGVVMLSDFEGDFSVFGSFAVSVFGSGVFVSFPLDRPMLLFVFVIGVIVGVSFFALLR